MKNKTSNLAKFASKSNANQNHTKRAIKIIVCIALSALFASVASAYYIGGMYVTLVDCSWGQYGYEYGNIGTYKDSSGKLYQVFFGSNACQY